MEGRSQQAPHPWQEPASSHRGRVLSRRRPLRRRVSAHQTARATPFTARRSRPSLKGAARACLSVVHLFDTWGASHFYEAADAASWDGWTVEFEGETGGWAGLDLFVVLTFEELE